MATYRVPVLQDFNWQPNVLDKDLGTPAGGEAKGDRYIVSANGGAWSDGAAKDIAWWDGAAWNFDTPDEGWQCWVEDEDLYYYFNGTNWVVQDTAANASNISSHTIQIASLESKQVADNNDISSHTIQIASLESMQVVDTGNISSHTIQIASNEGDISSHTIQIVSNENDISSHTIQIASLESQQVVDTGNISSHTIQIASLESKQTVDRASIDSVETIASANASNISSHTIELASAQEEGVYVAEYGAIEFTI